MQQPARIGNASELVWRVVSLERTPDRPKNDFHARLVFAEPNSLSKTNEMGLYAAKTDSVRCQLKPAWKWFAEVPTGILEGDEMGKTRAHSDASDDNLRLFPTGTFVNLPAAIAGLLPEFLPELRVAAARSNGPRYLSL